MNCDPLKYKVYTTAEKRDKLEIIRRTVGGGQLRSVDAGTFFLGTIVPGITGGTVMGEALSQ